MVQHGPIWSKIIKKCPKLSKNCLKLSKIVQKGPKLSKGSKMAQKGLKWIFSIVFQMGPAQPGPVVSELGSYFTR